MEMAERIFAKHRDVFVALGVDPDAEFKLICETVLKNAES